MATEVYRCLHCGAEIEPNRKRCRECGRGLEEVARPSEERLGRVAQWPLVVILLLGVGGAVRGIRQLVRNSPAVAVRGPDRAELLVTPTPEPKPAPEPRPVPKPPASDPRPPRVSQPPADFTLRREYRAATERNVETASPALREPAQSEFLSSNAGNTVAPTLPQIAPPQPAARPPESAEINRPAVPESPWPVLPSRPKPQAEPAPAIPAQGTVIWSGILRKNEEVVIEGTQVSRGTLTGALPGVPVLVSLDSLDFGLAEMPGPSNGWKRIVLRSRVNRDSVVSVRWTLLR